MRHWPYSRTVGKHYKKTPLMRNFNILGLIFLTFLVAISCDKEKTNDNPTIKFIQPDSNLIITHDTIIRFVVEPKDIDGDIVKVDFVINGVTKQTIDSPPYQFDWYDAKLDNVGIFIVDAIAYDNKGDTGVARIKIEINDYRIKYFGNFYFTIMTEHWMLGRPNTYDTSIYNGLIRKYLSTDSENDQYSSDDSKENPIDKITIEFKQNTKITTLLRSNGELIGKNGNHYCHNGKYNNIDTIEFAVGCLGGLGAGWNYKVKGIRK
jgi:hypothetical protein